MDFIFDDLQTMLQIDTKSYSVRIVRMCSISWYCAFHYLNYRFWRELQSVQPQNSMLGNYLTYLSSQGTFDSPNP